MNRAKTVSQIARIKGPAARDRADKAYDKANGIKQGSARDKAVDAKTRVSTYEYGPKGKKK